MSDGAVSDAPDDVELRVLALVRDQLNVDVPDPDTDLIGTGLLDSLAIVMLIAALEESFGCVLPLDDFDIEHFRSARRVTAFLASCGVLETWDAR